MMLGLPGGLPKRRRRHVHIFSKYFIIVADIVKTGHHCNFADFTVSFCKQGGALADSVKINILYQRHLRDRPKQAAQVPLADMKLL